MAEPHTFLHEISTNSQPNNPLNQTLNQIKIKSSPKESNRETEISLLNRKQTVIEQKTKKGEKMPTF